MSVLRKHITCLFERESDRKRERLTGLPSSAGAGPV